MPNFFKNYKNNVLSAVSALMLSFFAFFSLQGCSSSGDDAVVVIDDADPTGYYTGTADVMPDSTTNLLIDDLQGMINGTRFMVMSVENTLLYDGTITDVSVNDFTANVTIYKDGLLVSTTTMTGTITEGSQITGTITGTDAFNGTFTIVFALSNNEPSAISKVENTLGEVWSGKIEPTSARDQRFSINSAGALIDNDAPTSGVFSFCGIDTGTITAIANTRLYDTSLKLIECDDPNVDGSYTGLATTKGTDNILVFAYSNGTFAAFADYTLVTLTP
jgi:hypothetical protein